MSGSALGDPTARVSPRPFGAKASESWVFCRFPLMRGQSYLPLPIVRAFTIVPGLAYLLLRLSAWSASISLADCMTYYALC